MGLGGGYRGGVLLIDPDLLALAAVFGVMSLLIMVAALRGRLARQVGRRRRNEPSHKLVE